ncbi:hypothetical protein PRN20_06265 [Devosia sp. ZB163]|nr:hypothetical protein [Devosia sp. ZB163]MDC9823329.1 hypothetical protein [Devosia sp. ZB163]
MPGYIPPIGAYSAGGYEVEEAPAAFAQGSAEALVGAATKAARSVVEVG